MANDNYSEGKYSDVQIALLEQITYISSDVLAVAHIPDEGETPLCLPMNEGDKISDVLFEFTPEKIELLRERGDELIGKSRISGAEWASIIEAIKADPELMALEVVKCEKSDNGKANLNVCYKDNETGEGIITYKGTTGHDEWYDNCQGLVETDTDDQEAAYEFYEDVEDQFSEITVAGHSKGANKAMYVMIRADDDKIKRCVAFDGQGFSNEFLEHYAGEIERHSKKIINYALSVDFVHALLKQIPNAKMEFVQGYCLGDGGQYHSPNSFFIMDDNGNIQMQNGEPQFDIVPEDDDNIKHINGFTTYIMDNYPKEELEEMADYMGNFVAIALGDNDAEAAFKYLLSEPEKFKKFKGMILEYGKENNLTERDFNSFIGTFFPNEEDAQLVERICHALNEDGICDAIIESVNNHDNSLEGVASQIDNYSYLLDQGLAGVGAFLGEKVEQQFQQWGEEISEVGENIAQNIADFASSASDSVTSTLSDVAGTIDEATESASEQINTATENASQHINQVTESTANNIDNYSEELAETIQEQGESHGFLSGVANGAAYVIQAGGDIASGAVEIGGDVAGGAVETVGDFFGGAVELFGDVASGTVDTVGEVAGGAIDASGGLVGGVVEAVGDFADGTVERVGAALGGIVEMAVAGQGTTIEQFGNIVEQQMETFETVGNFVHGVSENPGDIVDLTGDFLADTAENIGESIGDTAEYIGNIFEQGIDDLGIMINTFFSNGGFNETYTPIENIDEYMNSVRKSIIKPAENQPLPVARKAVAHC